MNTLLRFFFLFSFATWMTTSHAMQVAFDFETLKQEQQYHQLISELRCLVCQNQNIADSSSSLAQNLRAKTHELVNRQQSDEEIKQFMASRYGDFILYSPPITPYTILLWGLPFALLIATISLFLYQYKRHKKV